MESYKIVLEAVGYMLAVTHARKEISSIHSDEFIAIRHGRYFEFINLVQSKASETGKDPVPVIYSADLTGNVPARLEGPAADDDVDFLKLLKAGPSIERFLRSCGPVYGPMGNLSLTRNDYYRMAEYELGIRMFGKNKSLVNSSMELTEIVDLLSSAFGLPDEDKVALHQGRRFLNYIKHPRNQFPDLSTGLIAFDSAYAVIQKNRWLVF